MQNLWSMPWPPNPALLSTKRLSQEDHKLSRWGDLLRHGTAHDTGYVAGFILWGTYFITGTLRFYYGSHHEK